MTHSPENDSYTGMLVRAHFKPGQKVYTFNPEFSLADVQAALFESTYRAPKPLRIRMQLDEIVELRVIVTSVEQLYQPQDETPGQAPFACFDDPDWYIEGWIHQSGFDPFAGPLRVRLYVMADDRKITEPGYFQRIVEPQRGEIEVVDSAIPPSSRPSSHPA